MGSHVVTSKDVLESLMSDGTFDDIRLKIINQLKDNEELKKNTITMVEQSRVLNIPGAEKKTKRELLDALRQELEMPMLEKAAKAIWEMILDDGGVGKEISENVERVYCRLSGLDVLPLPPPPTSDAQQSQKVKENKEGRQKVKEIMSKSSSRKKALRQLSMRREEIVKKGFCDHPPVVLEDGALSSTNSNA